MTNRPWIPITMLMWLPVAVPGASGDDWLDRPDPEQTHRAINEGQLTFLRKPPDKPVHHHRNTMVITRRSLVDGWVRLSQCHDNLDRFPRVQVVYNRKRIRKLRITAYRGIERAWVEGASVQLRNVRKGALLCIKAESRALRRMANGRYELRNGPFMRRFLDGYFPMRVSIDVKLPPGLRFTGISPAPQPGMRVTADSHGVHVRALFEGRLFTRIRLRYSRPDPAR